MTQSYPSDLTDDQWSLLEALLPSAKPGGRPRTVDLRAVVNAILYILCTGCPWRYLSKDYPNCKTVFHYFARWRDDGTWLQVHLLSQQTSPPYFQLEPASPKIIEELFNIVD